LLQGVVNDGKEFKPQEVYRDDSMAAAAGLGGAGLWRLLGAREGEERAGKPGDENGLITE